jgi:hypothetical protein
MSLMRAVDTDIFSRISKALVLFNDEMKRPAPGGFFGVARAILKNLVSVDFWDAIYEPVD